MVVTAEITGLHAKLKGGDISVAPALRLALAKLGNQLLLQGKLSSDPTVAQLTADVYEQSALAAIQKENVGEFERFVKQLKVIYYSNTSSTGVQPSAKILGLYLFFLLASDRIGEFHTELELLPKAILHDPLVMKPVELERYLMEGNYNKVQKFVEELTASDADQKLYVGLSTKLMTTVRVRVLSALQKSLTTNEVPVALACKLLYLNPTGLGPFLEQVMSEEDEAAAAAAATTDNSGASSDIDMSGVSLSEKRYEIVGDKLIFRKASGVVTKVNAYESLSNVIGYATEIERIV